MICTNPPALLKPQQPHKFAKWANLASSSPRPFPCQMVGRVVFFHPLISQIKQRSFSFCCGEVTILFFVTLMWSHLYTQTPVCSECRGDPAVHVQVHSPRPGSSYTVTCVYIKTKCGTRFLKNHQNLPDDMKALHRTLIVHFSLQVGFHPVTNRVQQGATCSLAASEARGHEKSLHRP